LIWLLALAALAQTSDFQATQDKASALLDQLENQHDWGDADRARAEELSKAVNTLWFVCLGKAELRLHDSKDEVATIATAVLGSCESAEQLYVRSLRSVFRGHGPVEIHEMVSRIDADARGQARERIITYLVNYRLSPPQHQK
jgi:hypothetical protein